MRSRQYSMDVVADDATERSRRRRGELPLVTAEPGVVLEEPGTGYVGAVIATARDCFTLEDRSGRRRMFSWQAATFSYEGRLVRVVPPPAQRVSSPTPSRSASGSLHVGGLTARVAQPSRIFVEGRHDAELVEKIWGHDLRVEGVVVELLEGVDQLPAAMKAFQPAPDRRAGVLVDHLVPGSKESRVVAELQNPYVLVTGHPYVDIWQAVRPNVLGLQTWPTIPLGQPWKEGICEALGWGEPQEAWARILTATRSYADLETPLLGAVERLIDFVTGPPMTGPPMTGPR